MGWHGVELRHLVALQAVAKERSFSAAATKLGYTQSAISGQILALERAIGARVFDRIRGSRPLQLTAEGEILLAHASAINARLDSAQRELAALAGTGDSLRIGTFPTVAQTLVPEALSRLSAEDPAADLQLREGHDLNGLLDGLERGTFDLVFTVLPLRAGPFATTEIYRDEHVLVCPRTNALARAPLLSRAELERLPLIVVAADGASGALNVVRRLEDVVSILAFVSAGLGVGFVPSLALPDLAPDLAAVRIEARAATRVVALAWHAERPLGTRAARFVELAAIVGSTLRRPLRRES